jgi:hypothetical protein
MSTFTLTLILGIYVLLIIIESMHRTITHLRQAIDRHAQLNRSLESQLRLSRKLQK